MPNQLLRNRASDAIHDAARKARSAAGLDHAGLRGRVREFASNDFFEPFLPGAFKIGTGKIVDAWDGQSAETDLIIYSRNVLPPVLYSERDGVFPIEACFYAIEVKSVVTAQEIDDTIRKMRQLRTLKYRSGEYENGRPLDHQLHPVVPTLFGFESDVSGSKSEWTRYIERDEEWKTNPAVRAICVLGKGYWRYTGPPDNWRFHEPTTKHDEVIDFLSGIANTLPDALVSRGRPRLGNYLVLNEARSVPVHPRGAI